MTVLLFEHGDMIVATAAWSAAAKPGKNVQLCYKWGADHSAFVQGATGIARVTLGIDMVRFMELVTRAPPGGVVDLMRNL